MLNCVKGWSKASFMVRVIDILVDDLEALYPDFRTLMDYQQSVYRKSLEQGMNCLLFPIYLALYKYMRYILIT